MRPFSLLGQVVGPERPAGYAPEPGKRPLPGSADKALPAGEALGSFTPPPPESASEGLTRGLVGLGLMTAIAVGLYIAFGKYSDSNSPVTESAR